MPKIWTKKPDFEAVGLTLGGTTLWTRDLNWLKKKINYGCTIIEEVLKDNITLSREHLLTISSVVAGIDKNLTPKVFQVLLRESLHLGRVISMPCLAASGKLFRVFAHKENITLFEQCIDWIIDTLRTGKIVSVKSLQLNQPSFLKDQLDAYTASHLLARTAYLGKAVYIEKDFFSWPIEVENAVRDSL